MTPGISGRNLASLGLLGLAAIIVACQPNDSARTPPTGDTKNQMPENRSDPPTLVELENASYHGIAAESIALRGGRWEGEPFVAGGASRPTIGLVSGLRVTGDLTGDGREEAAVLLWSNSGGSGTYDYVAVMGRNADGAVTNLGTAALGDRVQLRSAQITGGEIVLLLIQAGETDAACCPGQKWQRRFALQGPELVETASENLGRLSIADLAGVEWRLTDFDIGERVPDDVDITLVFNADRIGGKSACNRYNGSVVAGPMPGDLVVNEPMASTMMACPPPLDGIERRYQSSLQQLRRFSFQAGSLALHWRNDGDNGTMLFAAAELPE